VLQRMSRALAARAIARIPKAPSKAAAVLLQASSTLLAPTPPVHRPVLMPLPSSPRSLFPSTASACVDYCSSPASFILPRRRPSLSPQRCSCGNCGVSCCAAQPGQHQCSHLTFTASSLSSGFSLLSPSPSHSTLHLTVAA
jgi:hypothetical protein